MRDPLAGQEMVNVNAEKNLKSRDDEDGPWQEQC